jgi:acylphosphatase
MLQAEERATMQPKSEEERRLHAVVSGYVQGVGYRMYAYRRASALGLRGYVRNRHDGGVEVVAEGPRTELERLLGILRRGPASAEVTGVTVTWSAPRHDVTLFTIQH